VGVANISVLFISHCKLINKSHIFQENTECVGLKVASINYISVNLPHKNYVNYWTVVFLLNNAIDTGLLPKALGRKSPVITASRSTTAIRKRLLQLPTVKPSSNFCKRRVQLSAKLTTEMK